MPSSDTMGVVEETSTPGGRREALVLLALIAATAAALAGVSGLVRRFQAWQGVLALRMNERGQIALKTGNAELAINFFRSALAFRRDDSSALLNLAQSLIAENRLEEAEAYLRSLWDREPQDGTVNLELARLAVKRREAADALRYYHNAVYGIWSSDPVENRIHTRLELINYLLQQNSVTQAQSELIAMEAGLPPDSQLHTKVGQLFLSIGDFRNAENEFLQALKANRNDAAAAAGAGKAAFRLGHYRTAILYLDAAIAKDPRDQQTRDMLDNARLVLEHDPFLRNLSALERDERIRKAYGIATNRLDNCVRGQNTSADSSGTQGDNTGAADAAMQNLLTRERQLRSQMRTSSWMRNPELPAAAMSFVFDVEEQTAQLCGEPTGVDEALLLIARNREGVER